MGLDHLCSTGGMKIMVNFISIDPCITGHVLQLFKQGILSNRNTWEPWCWICGSSFAVVTNRKLLSHCQHWEEACWYTCPRDEHDISTLLKLHCRKCSALVLSPEIWSWKFWSPGLKFSSKISVTGSGERETELDALNKETPDWKEWEQLGRRDLQLRLLNKVRPNWRDWEKLGRRDWQLRLLNDTS